MNRERLLVGLAAIFAGLTMLLVVVALARQPFLLLLAVPFGATTYLLWYHVSGRLAARIQRREARRFARGGHGEGSGRRGGTESRRRRGPGGQRRARSAGGRGESDRQWTDGRSRQWERRSRRGQRRDGRGRGQARVSREPGMSAEEAYRVLGLDAGADAPTVKQAYREKVKSVHPDTATGDEATFKRVNRAYERLSEN